MLRLPGFLVDASRCDETPPHHLPQSPAGSPDTSLGSSDLAQQLGQRRNSRPATEEMRGRKLKAEMVKLGNPIFSGKKHTSFIEKVYRDVLAVLLYKFVLS